MLLPLFTARPPFTPLLEGALIPGGGGGTAAEADVDSNEDEDEEEAVAVAVAAGAAPPTPPLPELLLLLALALVPAGLGSLGAFACRGFDHAFMGAAFMVEAARQVQERSEGTVRGLLNERIALLLSTGNRPAIEGEEVEEASGDREPMPLCEKVSSLSTAYLTVAKMEGWRNGDHVLFSRPLRSSRLPRCLTLSLSLCQDLGRSKQQAASDETTTLKSYQWWGTRSSPSHPAGTLRRPSAFVRGPGGGD